MEEVQGTFLEVRLATESFLKDKVSPSSDGSAVVVPTTTSGNHDNIDGDNVSNISVSSNRLSDFKEIKLALELPKAEYLKFSGDPIEYFSFITNFEVNIESKLSCNATRLQHLKTMCKGKARSYIECCDLLGDGGYDEAKCILKSQFGQPHMILGALMHELTNRNPVRANDADSLWDLIASMKKCFVTLTKLGYTNDLNSTTNILKVQDLLPNHLQTTWIKKAHDILTSENREPGFKDLLSLLVKNAEISSTMFGKNLSKSRHSASDRRSHESVNVQSNHISSKPVRCFVCDGNHQVYKCKELVEGNYEKRVEIAKSKRLCFRCLVSGHIGSRCTRKWTCKCGSEKHHNMLHPPSPPVVEVTDEAKVNSGVVSSGNKVFMRILPVIVTAKNGNQVSTLALLDHGSDTSLCSEDLRCALGARGERLKYTSSTINGDLENEGWKFDLGVKGKFECQEMNVEFLTVAKIPAPMESFPTV
ncbi:uncharacterized protein [Antedon mediterranea]|uniref:uncharacterized protein n=1 Tax=Antedon mediterranea TaxID=105859 RepID=UPI003AF5A9D2